MAEGTSFVLLMFVAMPLKYMADLPLAVRIAGSLHGMLFLVFAAALYAATRESGWGWLRALWFLFLSTVPFGALVIEWQAREDVVGEPA
ncbi:MAG: DUF3817 domain-containing protein [Alphaproteobacteria bacterium]|nr:DUF3817 domain-containing protein [Alphaproteobacteria bacterium]